MRISSLLSVVVPGRSRKQTSAIRSSIELVAIRTSHNTAVLSEAVITRAPSGLNAAADIGASHANEAISLPVRASQIRAVWSAEAVRIRKPSMLNTAEVTELRW